MSATTIFRAERDALLASVSGACLCCGAAMGPAKVHVLTPVGKIRAADVDAVCAAGHRRTDFVHETSAGWVRDGGLWVLGGEQRTPEIGVLVARRA